MVSCWTIRKTVSGPAGADIPVNSCSSCFSNSVAADVVVQTLVAERMRFSWLTVVVNTRHRHLIRQAGRSRAHSRDGIHFNLIGACPSFLSSCKYRWRGGIRKQSWFKDFEVKRQRPTDASCWVGWFLLSSFTLAFFQSAVFSLPYMSHITSDMMRNYSNKVKSDRRSMDWLQVHAKENFWYLFHSFQFFMSALFLYL